MFQAAGHNSMQLMLGVAVLHVSFFFPWYLITLLHLKSFQLSDWGTFQALSSLLSPNKGVAVMNVATKGLSGKALVYTGINIS